MGACPPFFVLKSIDLSTEMVANFPNGGTVTNGLVQCNRLIVEDCGLTNAYMKRVIRNRVANGQHIAEIWVSGQNAPIYIKSEE